MKTAVNFENFTDAFSTNDRQDQFSYDGKKALFEYLEEYEDSTGEEIELDIISLCCDYSEYDSATACIKECGYGMELRLDSDEEEKEVAAIEYLEDRTTVIKFDTGIIIQDF